MKESSISANERLWGFIRKREAWRLSMRGWLLITFLVVFGLFLFARYVHPFLALTQRVDAQALIVEGWMHDYGITAAVAEFEGKRYQCVIATGGPVAGSGGYINDFNTTASVAAERLKARGVADNALYMVPSRVSGRDRTYSAALALKNWMGKQNLKIYAINVITEDAHARRSRLLYQQALGPEIKVGVIAIPNPDYDSKRWWRYSQGVREVTGESLAYVYAKVFFRPE